jgi:4-diphosphocytidyl-2-C-methyl-D-erythritol kinase
MYERLDVLRRNETVTLPDTVSEAFLDALFRGDAEALGPLLHNDMQRSALDALPSLRMVLEEGVHAGALGVLVSGSGPTVVWLARDEKHATALAGHAGEKGFFAKVCQSPARGAHLVVE